MFHFSALLLTVAFALPTAPVTPEAPPAGRSTTLLLEMRGTDVGETRMIDGVPMVCFDVDLVDVLSGRVIGHGTDCLDMASMTADPSGGPGFAISNTSLFQLPQGSLKTRNRTTVQPILEGSPGLTHGTTDVATALNVLEANGGFNGARGIARLHGGVDMSRFTTDNVISFNCLFVITLYQEQDGIKG
ncbi:MAG: hypothetical protein AAF628_26110 [Planctomycetota bacterium]